MNYDDILKRSVKKGKIPKFSHAKKGVAIEQNAQSFELGSFNFSILWIILEPSEPKLELPECLQAPVHNWPDYNQNSNPT